MHKDYGFVRVATGVPIIEVANPKHNMEEIYELVKKAHSEKINILCLPELSITGYTCQDLFFHDLLISESEKCVLQLLKKTSKMKILFAFGAPVKFQGSLYNCAILALEGEILAVIPKTYIPNYGEFYEKRWFKVLKTSEEKITYANQHVPFGTEIILRDVKNSDLSIATEICEDMWAPIPKSNIHAINGANIILNLSASNDAVGKFEYRRSLVERQSSSLICAYLYASSGFGESTSDLVFSGHTMIAEYGSMLAENREFTMNSKLDWADVDIEKLVNMRQKNSTYSDSKGEYDKKYRYIDVNLGIEETFSDLLSSKDIVNRNIEKLPFVPSNLDNREKRCEDIFNIQVYGLIKRMLHINASSMVIGISGGLDSTLALLVAVKAADEMKLPRNIIKAITMPGFGTTDRTYHNAVTMINRLGAEFQEISIKDAVLQHFQDIGQNPDLRDVTYENSQARERTQILMDIANKESGIVIGTGDLSELALGFATYNGDHMSMYAVNASIPKTLIRYIIKFVADTNKDEKLKVSLYDVIDTPVSPELLPPDESGDIAQITEDIVGPYELHDFFLYNILRFGYSPMKIFILANQAFEGEYTEKEIYKWERKFFWRFISQQFKRNCMPDAPKVGNICLSPRGDLRMPADTSSKLWMNELDELEKIIRK